MAHKDKQKPQFTRAALLKRTISFLETLASHSSPAKIAAHFTQSNATHIFIHEHGLPQLAPFLGRDFTGSEGVTQYFEIIGSCLEYENMKFDDFLVDEVEGRVSVRGEAKFMWRDSGQGWDEVFRYVLGFAPGGDTEGEERVEADSDGDGKLVRYEIWADTGAAYLARKGKLDESGDSKGDGGSTTNGEHEFPGQMVEAQKRTEGGELERYVMSCENFMKLNGLK